MEIKICVPQSLLEEANFEALKTYLDGMFFC